MMRIIKENIVILAGTAAVLLSLINIYFVTTYQKKLADEKNQVNRKCLNLSRNCRVRLNPAIIDRALETGVQFLLKNQLPEGNFIDLYDYREKTEKIMSQVSQGMALWGLVAVNEQLKDPRLDAAIEKGFSYFEKYIRTVEGKKWLVLPDESSGKTGVVALYLLALLEGMDLRSSSSPDAINDTLDSDIEQLVAFLLAQRTNNNRFHRFYDLETGSGFGKPSAYVDGECLLALVIAAQELQKQNLQKIVIEIGNSLYAVNVVDALGESRASKQMKAFYQYGSRSYYELAATGWEGTEQCGDRCLEMTDWMIESNCVLVRSGKISYAYDGIILAYNLANERNDRRRASQYLCMADSGLLRLTSWQVGGPVQNPIMNRLSITDKRAIGGIVSHQRNTELRLDLVKHHLHGMIFARRLIYIK